MGAQMISVASAVTRLVASESLAETFSSPTPGAAS